MSDADARRILAAYERAPYPSQEALRAGAVFAPRLKVRPLIARIDRA